MPLKEILLHKWPTSFHDGKRVAHALAQPPSDDRQAVLAEVERHLDEYLEARNEFERVLHLVLNGNQPSEAVNTLHALMDAVDGRKLALDWYVATAAEAAGED